MNILSRVKQSKIQFKFLFMITTAYIASGINMQGFMSMMPLVRDDFGLTRAQAGLYSTFYFLTATAVAIFSGNIVDRVGSKAGMVFASISLGLLMILHAFASSFTVILILALFAGIGFSIITPSANKAVMRRVSPQRRAISMGIMQSGGGIGGFLGASLLPLLAVRTGWRYALIFSAVFALLIGVFIYRRYEENPGGEEAQKKSGGDDDTTLRESLKVLLKNRQLLAVCSLGLIFSLVSGAVPAHYTLYLTQNINMNTTAAGLSLGILQIGGIFGRPYWGGLDDKMFGGNRSRGLIMLGIIMTAVIFLFTFYITRFNPGLIIVLISSFLLGMVAMGWHGLLQTTVAELATEKYTGIATGLSMIFVRTGIVISPPIFGYLADLTSTYYYSWLATGVFALIFTAVYAVLFRRLFA